MSPQLRKDLEYIWPQLQSQERTDPQVVKNVIEARLPERAGAYTLQEITTAVNELTSHQ